MRSYTIWRSYKARLVGQSLSTGEEVLPDRCAITQMLSDISFAPHDVSTPQSFNSLISSSSDERMYHLGYRLQDIFEAPSSLDIAPDTLDKAWSIEGLEVLNPFALSPGIKYLTADVNTIPIGIEADGDEFEFRLRASICAPGVLVPLRASLAPLCDALVQLTKHDYFELEGSEQRAIDSFLAKQKINSQTRRSKLFLEELGFALRILAEIIGLRTKPYQCNSGKRSNSFSMEKRILALDNWLMEGYFIKFGRLL